MNINLMFKIFTELKPLTSVAMREAEKKKEMQCSCSDTFFFIYYTDVYYMSSC